MSHRTLLISAVLAAGASLAGVAQADIVAVDSGIAVREPDGVAPARGMTMSQVTTKFGAPASKVPAVGNPPISRWEYPGFVVYFERDHVIHSVVSGSAAPPPDSAPQSAPVETPAASVAPPAPSAVEPAPPAAESAPPAAESAPPAAESAPPAAADTNVAAPAPAAAEPVEPPPAP